MNAAPASSSPELISPLASKLVQFLAQKHAMGYRYREEGRALPELEWSESLKWTGEAWEPGRTGKRCLILRIAIPARSLRTSTGYSERSRPLNAARLNIQPIGESRTRTK